MSKCDSSTSGSSSYPVSTKMSFTMGSRLYSTSMYFCHIYVTHLSSVTTFPRFPFMAPHLALKDPVISLISFSCYIVLFVCISPVSSCPCPVLLSPGRLHSNVYIHHRLLDVSSFFVYLRFPLLHLIAIWRVSSSWLLTTFCLRLCSVFYYFSDVIPQ